MLLAPNLSGLPWLVHGFGFRDSEYPANITRAHQIHSATVLDAGGAPREFAGEGDALTSNLPGVIVGIRTADCVPVLIADSATQSVASVHAGWRGSAQKIVLAAVRELVTRYGARAEDLHAAIGPAIGECCYEVGPEVARQFEEWAPEPSGAGRARHIDLPKINAAQLASAGVRDVWLAGECTFCHPDRYFSFRREKEKAGRMTSFIGVL